MRHDFLLLEATCRLILFDAAAFGEPSDGHSRAHGVLPYFRLSCEERVLVELPLTALINVLGQVGPEAPLFFTVLPLGPGPQHTRGNTLLVYVQTTTARIDNFHRATPFYRAALDASKSENLLCVLSATSGGYNSLCFPASQPYSYAGSASARVRRPLSPPRLHKRYDISSSFSSFVVVLKEP